MWPQIIADEDCTRQIMDIQASPEVLEMDECKRGDAILSCYFEGGARKSSHAGLVVNGHLLDLRICHIAIPASAWLFPSSAMIEQQ